MSLEKVFEKVYEAGLRDAELMEKRISEFLDRKDAAFVTEISLRGLTLEVAPYIFMTVNLRYLEKMLEKLKQGDCDLIDVGVQAYQELSLLLSPMFVVRPTIVEVPQLPSSQSSQSRASRQG